MWYQIKSKQIKKRRMKTSLIFLVSVISAFLSIVTSQEKCVSICDSSYPLHTVDKVSLILYVYYIWLLYNTTTFLFSSSPSHCPNRKFIPNLFLIRKLCCQFTWSEQESDSYKMELELKYGFWNFIFFFRLIDTII